MSKHINFSYHQCLAMIYFCYLSLQSLLLEQVIIISTQFGLPEQ